MIRNLLMGFAALLVVASCKTASTAPHVELTPSVVAQALQASGQGNDADAQAALSANKPLLLVFWQSW